jgi:arylsulfatase A-like enzyme
MITRLDKQVGEILDKLEEKGMTENTIVIFTSDNGPHEEGGADPSFFNHDGLLRGTKRSTHEGGIRVPFIVRWPGTVEAGRVSDHQLAFYDILPTFCDIAGIGGYPEAFVNKNLEGDCFDGLSFYNELTGKPQEAHDFLYWEFHETNMMALRMGNWKMVVKNGNCMLYDLANDIHEDTDVAAKYPEVVKKMKEIILSQHTNSDLFKVTLPTL